MSSADTSLMTDSLVNDYPSIVDISIVVKLMLAGLPKDKQIDIDDFVYDAISSWDTYFEGDDEWFNEEDTDIKDSLRDQFLDWYGFNNVN